MRLLLIANVNAQTVTPRKVSVIERALSSEFEVDLVHTRERGHGIELGGEARDHDLVVAMGGDGTVNEVANGLAGSDVPMAIIPGGGTNVFARSLGIPEDPVEATGQLLANRERPPRRITLGRADGRHFLFTCGMGLDGAIVRKVERRQRMKKAVGQPYYVWSGLSTFFFRYGRRTPRVRVLWGPEMREERDGLFLAIGQNTSPYTYLGGRAMRLCPDAQLDLGLDLLTIDSMRLGFVLRLVMRALGRARHTRMRHVFSLHDEPAIEVVSEVPLPVQMDGEYVGKRERLLLEAVPGALSILY